MRQARVIRLMLGVFAATAVLGTAGCYERVVGAKGLGAEQYQVSEPYQENSKLDDWLFGAKKQNPNRINRD